MTKIEAITSAKTQYRAAFRAMARGGKWNLSRLPDGLILDLAEYQHGPVLVENVQAMTEQTLIIKLSNSL